MQLTRAEAKETFLRFVDILDEEKFITRIMRVSHWMRLDLDTVEISVPASSSQEHHRQEISIKVRGPIPPDGPFRGRMREWDFILRWSRADGFVHLSLGSENGQLRTLLGSLRSDEASLFWDRLVRLLGCDPSSPWP